MASVNAAIDQSPVTTDETAFFRAVGSNNGVDLTQVQPPDDLGIAKQQIASYEIDRRRVPVSPLAGLARARQRFLIERIEITLQQAAR